MADPKEIQRLLNELDRAYRRLGEQNPFSRQETDVRKLEAALRGVQTRLSAIDDDFGNIRGSILSSLDAMSKTNSTLNDTKKAFRGIESVAQKLRNDQAGIHELSLKELQSLDKKFKSRVADLQASRAQLENKKNSLEAEKQSLINAQRQEQANLSNSRLTVQQRENLRKSIRERGQDILKVNEDLRLTNEAYGETEGFLSEQDSLYSTINDKISFRIQQEERTNEALGIGGAALTSMSKTLDKMGLGGLKNALGLDGVNEKMKELAAQVAETGGEITYEDKLNVLKGGLKEAGAQFVKNLKDPLVAISFIVDQLIKAFTSVDKLTGGMAKQMGVSYNESQRMVAAMTNTANLSGETYITTQGMVESQITISKALGTSAMASGEMLKDFTLLTKQMGISTEAATTLSNLTLITGTDLSDNTSEILGSAKAFGANNKVALSNREILEGIKNISSATTLSLGMQPKELARSVAQAKALGLEMAQLEKLASSLLQFESSIEAELEAELLTGQQLNMEQARYLALQGDVAGAAAEIADQLGSAADFGKMNVIQQEALAKSVGLSRDELAKSLIEREALEKIGAKDAAAAKEQFDSLVERYGYEQAIKELGDEEYARQLASQSVQERFAAITQKLQETFVTMAPILTTITDSLLLAFNLLDPIFMIVGVIGEAFSYIGEAIRSIIPDLGLVGRILKGLASLAVIYAAYKAYASLAALPVVGVPLGIAAAAAVTSAGFGLLNGVTMADDMISPGYGKRTLLSPEGAIALNDNDTVVAGTNLGGRGGSSPSINIAPLVERMDRMNEVLNQILAKEGTVELDGTKVGTALTVGSYKLQ